MLLKAGRSINVQNRYGRVGAHDDIMDLDVDVIVDVDVMKVQTDGGAGAGQVDEGCGWCRWICLWCVLEERGRMSDLCEVWRKELPRSVVVRGTSGSCIRKSVVVARSE